ncbi:MAG TPA: hypothetical protein VIG29_16660 [Vicinamibacteria bacterium]|jgi:hypothetical protein
MNRAPAVSAELGFLAPFRHFFKRMLDEDKIVQGDYWLKKSGVQQQLEFEGFQLRWVEANRLDLSVGDGWNHVTVPHYLWWIRRVRRRHSGQHQYLMKKEKSFRSRTGY